MNKIFRPYFPEQQLLLPAALQEWLPSDHLAYFISGLVDHLDPRFRGGRLSRPSPSGIRARSGAALPITPR